MNNNRWIYVLVLTAVSCVTVLWFKQDYINGGDFMFPMAPTGNVLTNYYHIWTDKWGLGLVNSRAIPQLPFIALLTLAGHLGISTAVSERILFYLISFTSGVSIFYLVHILPFNEHKKMIASFAALFYMFNPFNIIFYWHILDGMIFVYAVIPALLILYLQWFRTRKIIYPILFFIVTALGGYTFSNPLVIPTLWIVLLFFNFLIVDCKKQKTEVLKFWVTAGILWSLVNSWWLVPLFGSISDEYAGLSATIGSPWNTLSAFSDSVSLLNLFRFSDLYWAFGKSIMGTPYYNYAVIYQSGIFKAISFILPIIVFLPLIKYLTKDKLPRFVLLLYGVTLCLFFLAKGNHPPFGEALYNILFKLPFLSAFRAPIHKLGVLISICYAVLFGYGLSVLYGILKKVGRPLAFSATVIISSLVIVVYSYPLWTGEVIHDGGKNYPSFHVNVPDYYSSAAEWLNSKSEYSRFYSMPQSPTFNVAYDWENGALVGDPSFNFFSKPGVYSTVDPVAQLPFSLLRDDDQVDIYKILRLQGVRYILFHKDVNDELWDIFTGKHKPFEHLETSLVNQKEITLSKEFGKLSFYTLSDKVFLPPIYSSPEVHVIHGNGKQLKELINTDYLDGNPAIAFTEDQNAGNLRSLFDYARKKEGNMILANRNIDDLALDLVKAEVEKNGRKCTIDHQNPCILNFNVEGKGKYNINEEGHYEIWINASDYMSVLKENTNVYRNFFVKTQNLTMKWLKIRADRFKKGEYEIALDDWAEEQKNISVGRIQAVVVSVNKRIEYSDLIKKNASSYLFYIDEDLAAVIADAADISDDDAKNKNPYKILHNRFHLPRDEDYLVRAYLKPKRTFIKEKSIMINNIIKASQDDISGWEIDPHLKKTAIYNEKGLNIKVNFTGDVDSGEKVVLTKEFNNISLKNQPYLVLRYSLQNPNIQEAVINIWVKNEDGKILKKKISLWPINSSYSVNLYEEALKIFNTSVADNLEVGFVKIVVKTKEGIKVSNPLLYGLQVFTLKNFVFMKNQLIQADFTDSLEDYSQERYFFNINGILHKAVLFEEIPQHVKEIYKVLGKNYIDLRENPLITLNLSNIQSGANLINIHQEFNVTLAVDFDGDGKEDSRLDVRQGLIPTSSGMRLSVPAYEAVINNFPDKKHYNLLGLSIGRPEDKNLLYQRVMSEEIVRYQEHVYSVDDIEQTADILKIDDKTFKSMKDYQVNANDKYLQVEFKSKLDAGMHKIETIEHDKYKVEMVDIRPDVKNQTVEAVSSDGPQINFIKISPTKYVVSVLGAKGPFTLVFSEHYHGGWKAYKKEMLENDNPTSDNNQKILADSVLWNAWKDRGNRTEIKDHFTINGYANGWIVPVNTDSVNKESNKGENFTIILEFWPQRFFEIGVIISVVVLIGFIGYININRMRTRNSKL